MQRREFDEWGGDRADRRQPWTRLLLVLLVLAAGASACFLALKPGLRGRIGSVLPQGEEPASSAVLSAPQAAAPVSSAPASSAPAPAEESSAPALIPLAEAEKPLSVQVLLSEQKVRVLDAQGRPVKEFICSSGKEGDETPVGTFTVSDRGKSFFNAKVEEGAYYWTRFYGTYLFHSVPFDKDYKMEQEEADKLGEPASHGCIRLPVEDAKWIYDNIPEGTKVVIQ